MPEQELSHSPQILWYLQKVLLLVNVDIVPLLSSFPQKQTETRPQREFTWQVQAPCGKQGRGMGTDGRRRRGPGRFTPPGASAAHTSELPQTGQGAGSSHTNTPVVPEAQPGLPTPWHSGGRLRNPPQRGRAKTILSQGALDVPAVPASPVPTPRAEAGKEEHRLWGRLPGTESSLGHLQALRSWASRLASLCSACPPGEKGVIQQLPGKVVGRV